MQQQQQQQQNNLIIKSAKELNRHFSKVGIQVASKHIENMLIREMKIKIMRYYFSPIRMFTFKKHEISVCNGIILAQKKEGNSDTCYNMGESCGHA